MTRPGWPLFNGAKPKNLVAPVASGTVVIGNVLSTTNGTWASVPAASYTYQWKRDGVSIGGATASTYTVVAADVGSSIAVVVTASNPAGSTAANSNALTFGWGDLAGLGVGGGDWWRADLGATVVSINQVSSLVGQANGTSVAQAVAAGRPTTGGVIGTNVRAALQFNGAQFLDETATSLIASGAARTIFCVARSSVPGGGALCGFRKSTAYASTLAFVSAGTHYIYNDGVNAAQSTSLSGTPFTGVITSDFYALWRFTGAGAAPTFRLNGAAKAVASGVQGNESGSAGFSLGSVGASAILWTGVVGTWVVAAAAWTANEQATAEAYAQKYYGLP